MELQQVRYFLEICRTLSFAKAADNCFISPQGISIAIQRLEADLECTLFVRGRSAVSLTKHAKYLLPLAEKIIDNVDVCDRYFSVGKDYSQHVPLVLARGAIYALTDAPMREYMETYPNVYLDIRNDSDIGAEKAVLCGEAELALCSGPIDNELFEAQFICSIRFAAIVRITHPLADQDTVSIEDLCPYPLTIMREHTKTYPVLHEAAKAAGVELWINSRVDNLGLVFEAAVYEGQVGIVTMEFAAAVNNPKSSLKAIPFKDPSVRWSLYLIKRKDEPLSQNAEQLYRILLKHRDLLTMNNLS